MSSADLAARLDAAALTGTRFAVWAGHQPDRIAVIDPDGTGHSYATVDANANRLVRLLRARGLRAGDGVALACSNRVAFIEAFVATQRSGLRLTPVNWHLTADEIGYIIADCEAKAVIAEARAPVAAAMRHAPGVAARLAVGEPIEGFEGYAEAVGAFDGGAIDDSVLGGTMLYTSGTTGRPKGVYRPTPVVLPQAAYALRGYDPATSVQLCVGPAYHAAPLLFDVTASVNAGVPLVLYDKWDSEGVLRTISERRVTHLHMVPIMFQRLLALPGAVKARWPVDHVRWLIHGAAPCPPEVKLAMIEWFGPVLTEYYGGSEGGVGFLIDSHEWMKKPGSVGKRPALLGTRILDEHGRELPNGEEGTIYQQIPPGAGFTYFNDPAKTAAGRIDGYFTMGDVGYFDADDYLFLTGRSAETIISGGVNIYPQEIDNELIKHEAVADVATVGVPHAEWGEQVRAVVELKPEFLASDELAEEILAFARVALPSFKVPRALDFAEGLPRSEAGKIQRGKVRAPYWDGMERKI